MTDLYSRLPTETPEEWMARCQREAYRSRVRGRVTALRRPR